MTGHDARTVGHDTRMASYTSGMALRISI